MSHILLTGATGRVGAGILALALQSPTISHITILSRRPVRLAEQSPKATVILHEDFSSYPPDLVSKLSGITGCIWAQGVSSVGISEEEYVKITHDYPLAAAKALAGKGEDKVNFVYISGEGVNWTGKGQLYSRIKGRAEQSLIQLSQKETRNLSVYSVRPGVIGASKSLGGNLAQRKANWTDVSLKIMAPVTELLWKSMAISTETLAKACLGLVVGDGRPVEGKGVCVEGEGRVLGNVALRRLGGT